MAEELKRMEAQAKGEKYEPAQKSESNIASNCVENSILKNQINSFTAKYMN